MEKNEVTVGSKYVLGKRLFKGSHCFIYRGYDNETFAPVAIKLVFPFHSFRSR
jgi:hypothetical protein